MGKTKFPYSRFWQGGVKDSINFSFNCVFDQAIGTIYAWSERVSGNNLTIMILIAEISLRKKHSLRYFLHRKEHGQVAESRYRTAKLRMMSPTKWIKKHNHVRGIFWLGSVPMVIWIETQAFQLAILKLITATLVFLYSVWLAFESSTACKLLLGLVAAFRSFFLTHSFLDAI